MLGDQMVNDICRIAALLHRAADMEYQPTKEEVKYLLPKPILPMKFMKPNRWVELVQENWADMSAISTMEAKAQCLDCLSKWPLFGSCFFAVKHCVEYNATDFPEYILALNRNGAYFLDIITHVSMPWSFSHFPPFKYCTHYRRCHRQCLSTQSDAAIRFRPLRTPSHTSKFSYSSIHKIFSYRKLLGKLVSSLSFPTLSDWKLNSSQTAREKPFLLQSGKNLTNFAIQELSVFSMAFWIILLRTDDKQKTVCSCL